jgi:hypothetical protein
VIMARLVARKADQLRRPRDAGDGGALCAEYEPAHPFGVKAVAEIPPDGVAPAVANAVYDAASVQVPVTR